jgi:hypothetical protein
MSDEKQKGVSALWPARNQPLDCGAGLRLLRVSALEGETRLRFSGEETLEMRAQLGAGRVLASISVQLFKHRAVANAAGAHSQI